jgi:hypothetical protein
LRFHRHAIAAGAVTKTESKKSEARTGCAGSCLAKISSGRCLVANVDVDAGHMDSDARPRRRAVAIDDDRIVMLDAFLHAGAAIANFFANPFGARRLRHRKHRCRRHAGEQSYVPHVVPPIKNF